MLHLANWHERERLLRQLIHVLVEVERYEGTSLERDRLRNMIYMVTDRRMFPVQFSEKETESLSEYCDFNKILWP